MERTNWSPVAVAALIILLVFVCGLGVLILSFRGFGQMGPGMMGDWCPWCGMGWYRGGLSIGLGEIMIILAAMLFLGLIVIGIIWAISAGGRGTTSRTECPDCGALVRSDWRNCPHCGAELRKQGGSDEAG